MYCCRCKCSAAFVDLVLQVEIGFCRFRCSAADGDVMLHVEM